MEAVMGMVIAGFAIGTLVAVVEAVRRRDD
jgi:hypothetical protein